MSPGEIVISGQLLVAVPLALLAGLVSFASPCVLPLVPGYLGYIGGLSGSATAPSGRAAAGGTATVERAAARTDRRRLVFGVLAFIGGFSLVFVLTGALAGTVGAFLVQHGDVLTRVLGAVVVLMGFVFVGQVSFLQRTLKPAARPATGLAGAPLLGIVFAIGWTPCLGPVLVAIQSMSLDAASPWRGALLAACYCLGLGLPFLALALGASWATRSTAFLRRHIRAINIAGGAMLIAIGVLMVTGLWGQLMSRLGAVMVGFVSPI